MMMASTPAAARARTRSRSAGRVPMAAATSSSLFNGSFVALGNSTFFLKCHDQEEISRFGGTEKKYLYMIVSYIFMCIYIYIYIHTSICNHLYRFVSIYSCTYNSRWYDPILNQDILCRLYFLGQSIKNHKQEYIEGTCKHGFNQHWWWHTRPKWWFHTLQKYHQNIPIDSLPKWALPPFSSGCSRGDLHVHYSLHPPTMFHNEYSKPVDADAQILITSHTLRCFHNGKPLNMRVGHPALGVNSSVLGSLTHPISRWHRWHSPSGLISVRATNATSRPLSVTMGNLPWQKWDAELNSGNKIPKSHSIILVGLIRDPSIGLSSSPMYRISALAFFMLSRVKLVENKTGTNSTNHPRPFAHGVKSRKTYSPLRSHCEAYSWRQQLN